MTEIVAINRMAGIALTDKDTVVHLTDFFDADGNSCIEEDAVAAVGWEPGSDGEGRWWSINLSEFTGGFSQ